MRCPHCGGDNPGNPRFCEICGRALAAARRVDPAGESRAPRASVQRPTSQPNRASAQRRRPVQSAQPPQRRSSSAAQRHPQSARRPAPGKPKTRWNPKFLAACAGILAVLILVPVLIAVVAHHADQIESNRIQMFYSGASGKTSVVLAGKVYEKTIPGKIAKTASASDGMTQAALTESGELYYIAQDKLASVATGVQSFVLSADGSHLAYVVVNTPDTSVSSESSTEEESTSVTRRHSSDVTESTSESTTEYVPAGAEPYLEYLDTSLFLYNGLDSTSPLIANHIAPESVSLSPSGTSIAYSVTAENNEGFEGFFYREGVSTSVGHNALPIAVSDDGMNYFYVKFDSIEDVWAQKLFGKCGETEVKLGEFADGNRLSVYVNRNCSEIVYSFTGTKGSYFFYMPGREKEKISVGFQPVYAYGLREVLSGKAVITPYESFARTVFVDAAGTAQRMDAKYVCTNTGAAGTVFRVTPDGKTIYYLDKDEYLYSCSVRKLDKKEIATHVLAFELSADGEIVYYVNSENELHCVKGSKNTLAAGNVYTSKGGGLAVTDSGHLYFLTNYAYGSGTLCYLKGDGSVHVLDEINNVHDLAADVGEYIYYRSDYGAISGTYDLYYGKGKKYTKLFEKMG